jgi:hypothetical protein
LGYNANGITDGDEPFGVSVHYKAAAPAVSGCEEDALFRYDVCKEDQVPSTAHVRSSLQGWHRFNHAYPTKKSEARDRLEKLLRKHQTIPEMIGAAEETGGDWERTLDKYWIQDKRK